MTAIPKSFLLFIMVVLPGFLLVSCQQKPVQLFGEGNDIFGLASPIELQEEITEVVLADYFRLESLQHIDSVEAHPAFRVTLQEGNQQLELAPVTLNIPPLSALTIWIDGNPYSLLVKQSVKENHTFRFDPRDQRYRNVAIRGEMTDWAPRPMTLVDGVWKINMNLNPGRYQYLIQVDGQDMLDPANPQQVSNNAGGYNSLIEVGNIDRAGTPQFTPVRENGYTITIKTQNQVEEVLVFWQNFMLPKTNIDLTDGKLDIKVPGDALLNERSFIRVFSYNETGQGNDLLIPLQYGNAVTQPDMLTREDREATIMYFLMVDRFFNGNPDRDDPVDDPEVADRANFHGGDLDGVLQKIQEGYFTDLGVNAVWFSPITQNPLEAYIEFPEPKRKYTGYHGYWPITLTTIDHRFGTDEVLEQLVESAHDRDISVLLDFVSNHVHKNNPLIINNPDWKTTLELPDGRQNIRIWDEHRLTTWFDDFLPTLDFSKPEVVQTMVDSAFYWIDRFNLDGFRHDATKHVPLEFWRSMTQKLKEEKMYPEDFRLFQIGETFGSRELIGSYVGSGLLDGQFDFNLYWDARSTFALDEVSFERLDYSLHQSFDYYGHQNLMGNITGNHDMPRFISYAGGSLSFDEDDTEPGWQRDVGVGDPTGYQKLSALTAFTLTIPGIPVIYYGDEIGLPGASDPDSRRPMVFENLSENQQQVKDNLKKLTAIRSDNLAFIYGDFNTLKVTDQAYAYARSYFDSQGIVLFNKGDEPLEVIIDLPRTFSQLTYDSHFDTEYRIENGKLTATLQPYSFEVLTH